MENVLLCFDDGSSLYPSARIFADASALDRPPTEAGSGNWRRDDFEKTAMLTEGPTKESSAPRFVTIINPVALVVSFPRAGDCSCHFKRGTGCSLLIPDGCALKEIIDPDRYPLSWYKTTSAFRKFHDSTWIIFKNL